MSAVNLQAAQQRGKQPAEKVEATLDGAWHYCATITFRTNIYVLLVGWQRAAILPTCLGVLCRSSERLAAMIAKLRDRMSADEEQRPIRARIDLHPAVWLVPAGMLLVALLPLPYGYYTLLRLIVCAAALLLAWQEHKAAGRFSGWAVGLALLGLLFNPLLPVHLGREVWAPLDIGGAMLLGLHWWSRRQLKRAQQRS